MSYAEPFTIPHLSFYYLPQPTPSLIERRDLRRSSFHRKPYIPKQGAWVLFENYIKECNSIVEVDLGSSHSIELFLKKFKINYISESRDDFLLADMLFANVVSPMADLIHILEHFSAMAKKYICLLYERENLETFLDWPTIQTFIKTHMEWDLERRYSGKVEFIVLKNKSFENYIDHTLKNKIILCTGPSLKRREALKKNTEDDLLLVPFKSIFLSTNDAENLNVIFQDKRPITELIYPERGHQLDCLNCIITTIKNAIRDVNTKDDDIILFKHESCCINDMYLMRRAVEKILNGHDMVVRYTNRDQYCHTNGFFIKVSAAKKIFTNLPTVTNFCEEYRFCEEYFTKVIVSAMSCPYIIGHDHTGRGVGELGFLHILPPWGGGEIPWDKKNYYQLFD